MKFRHFVDGKWILEIPDGTASLNSTVAVEQSGAHIQNTCDNGGTVEGRGLHTVITPEIDFLF